MTSAPAAADTITAHFNDTGRTLDHYDLIITGDLGLHGGDLFQELVMKAGLDISGKYVDCGGIIFSKDQNVKSGGSGCGCCSVTLASHWLDMMRRGEYGRLLIAATGALLSPASTMQGETIPGIAHAIVLEACE